MDLERNVPGTDECFDTALQIFDFCGAEYTDTLPVNILMDKLAPFVKTNKSEYSYLKFLLDPDQSNPEVNVSDLAKALHKYSENQSRKVDLDESFNLRNGQTPQDSDSGISTDGMQLLEELQSELKEKCHLAQQLRNQLDFSDRQHEEALAAFSAERNTFQTQINMLREENMTLSHVRRDYDDACDRLCSNEHALNEARREIDSSKKRMKVLNEQVSTLENEKLTLQELLTKSKEECHRINEMYASRQSNLIEENETLKTEHADLTARLQDQEEFMQQMIKEKVLLEMELKDVLNKSNQTQLKMDHSIDVSFTEDQMLIALDSLNADSRFAQEPHLLDEESFSNSLKEDHGRPTNMSLFDEIRLGFGNTKQDVFELARDTVCEKCNHNLDISSTTIGTQTEREYDEKQPYVVNNNDDLPDNYTDLSESEKVKQCMTKLKSDVEYPQNSLTDMQSNLNIYEDHLNILERLVKEGNERNMFLKTVIKNLESKVCLLEVACADQRRRIDSLDCATCCAQVQTESVEPVSVSTQADAPCAECQRRGAVVQHRSIRRYLCL